MFSLLFIDRRALLRARSNYLWLLLLSSLLLFICALIGLIKFRWTSGSTPFAFGISVGTLALSTLDLFRGHRMHHFTLIISTHIWFHLTTSWVLLGLSLYALAKQRLDLEADPIGWWTDPLEVMVIGFISLSLSFHGFMFLLKAAVLTVEVFYYNFCTYSPGIWTANILDWDWWGSPHNSIELNPLPTNSVDVTAEPSQPAFPDPVTPDPVASELLRPEPLILRTQGCEPPTLARIRGGIVVAICVGFFLYASESVVVGAGREKGAMPGKLVLVQDDEPSWNDRRNPAPVWSVVVAIDDAVVNSSTQLASSVTVTPLWDTESLSRQLPGNFSFPSCDLVQGPPSKSWDSYNDYDESHGTWLVTFLCPDLYGRSALNLADWVTSDTRVTSPDLLVSIDYDKLNISARDHLSVRHTAFVFMGFATDTSLVLRTSYGLPAISRTHNLATVHYKARQTIKAGSIPVGIFPSYNTFFFSDLNIIGPDIFPGVPQNDNTASLRLFTYYDPSDWRIIQDSPEYSLINIVSSLGGTWTVLNGIFSIIFGGSMLLTFGVKPLSVFGIAHKSCTQKIRKKLNKEFTEAERDVNRLTPEEMSALLEHYVLDLSILRGADNKVEWRCDYVQE